MEVEWNRRGGGGLRLGGCEEDIWLVGKMNLKRVGFCEDTVTLYGIKEVFRYITFLLSKSNDFCSYFK